ncbi:hypothetical protein [Enterococcus sp. AZ109]|uniref:hypothetical protein n=1 Tax=Enterococcus sp. AZ109 TaxID=2774634 RepID=UPI003F2420E9
MKKIILSILLLVSFVFPVVGEASSSSSYESLPTIQDNSVSPRALYSYIFPSVPPKTFNGRTRIYYEYKEKQGYYIGYYQ